MSKILDTPIEYVKGVGPARGDALKKELGIYTFFDLLHFFPFRYVDRSKFQNVADLTGEEQYVLLKGRITSFEIMGLNRAKRLVAKFRDETGSTELVWFQGINWLKDKIQINAEYIVFGKPTEYRGKVNFTHPEIDLAKDESVKLNSALQSVYSSTELLKRLSLDSKGILRLQETIVPQISGQIAETLTPEINQKYKLMPKEMALKQVHFPSSNDTLNQALYRLKFEELFYLQLKILRNKSFRNVQSQGFVMTKVGEYFNNFYTNYLPFELTNAQKRVIKEIRADLTKGKQMSRLVQGDVGSGKTMVALISMILAVDNGFQACLMAPTEILATQHFEGIEKLISPMGLKVALLTGSTKTKERNSIHERLQNGELNIIIGTHALIEPDVKFQNLGLAVIDEQHRFGVAQRAKLQLKNKIPPHTLIMTATPIPRTLAMTLYGDLEVSVIDELPPGRKPITTKHFTDSQRLRMFGFIREQIKLGRQVYVVYPLIEESEKLDFKNLHEGFESLELEFPLPEYQISMVHGKLTNERKEFEMQRFIKGQTQIMVATTVIEVGVNIPNASVMVIESAERFGLSQLHQLRGRVGRGAEQSYCLLMTSHKLSKESKKRMETMCRTNDGFEISEVDLELRGPGDIQGTQQSGLLNLRIADLAKDQRILQEARQAAMEILDNDELLAKPENALLANYLANEERSKINWSKIG